MIPEDDYLGSGNTIKKAIAKYGRENFVKEVLFIFETEADANDKERELLSDVVLADSLCYNLCEGGKGGNFIHRAGKTYEEIYGAERAVVVRAKISQSHVGEGNPFYGKTHSEEYRKRLTEESRFSGHTPEMRAAAMEKRKRRVLAGEILVGMTGKKHSEETKEKIRQTLLAKKHK